MWIVASGTKNPDNTITKKNSGIVVKGKGNHGGLLTTVNYSQKNLNDFNNVDPVINTNNKINSSESDPTKDLYTVNVEDDFLLIDKIEINGQVYSKSSLRINDGDNSKQMPIAGQFIYDENTKKIIIRIPSGNRKQIINENTSIKIIGQKQKENIGNQNLPVNLFPSIFRNLPLVGDFSWSLSWESDPSASLNLICDWTTIDQLRSLFIRGTEYTILGIGFRVSDYNEDEGAFGEIEGGLFFVSVSLEGYWNWYKEKEVYIRNDNRLTSGLTSVQALAQRLGVKINAPNCPVYYTPDTAIDETISWDSALQEFSRIYGSFLEYNYPSSVNMISINNVNSWQYSTKFNQLFPVSENESISVFITNSYKDKASSPKRQPNIPQILRKLSPDKLKSDLETKPVIETKNEKVSAITYENTGVTHIKLEWDKGNTIDGNYLEDKDQGSDIALDTLPDSIPDSDIDKWNNLEDLAFDRYNVDPERWQNDLEQLENDDPLNYFPPDMPNDKTNEIYSASEEDEDNEPNLFPMPRWVRREIKELTIEDGDTENLGSPPPKVRKINVDSVWSKSGLTKVHTTKKTKDGLPIEDEVNTYGYFGTALDGLQGTIPWGQVKHEKTIHIYERNMYVGYNTYGWQLIQLQSENTKEPETLKIKKQMEGLNSSSNEFKKLQQKIDLYKFISVPIVVRNRKQLGQYSDHYIDIQKKERPPFELYKVCQRNGKSTTIAVVQPEFVPAMFEFSDQTKRDSFHYAPNPDYIPPKPKEGGGMTEPQGAEYITTGEDSFIRKTIKLMPAKTKGFKQKVQGSDVSTENIYEGKDMISTVDIKFSASGANFNDAAEDTSINVSEGRPPAATGFSNPYELEWVEPNKKKKNTKKDKSKKPKPPIIEMDSACGIQPDKLKGHLPEYNPNPPDPPQNPPIYIPPRDGNPLVETDNQPKIIVDKYPFPEKTNEDIIKDIPRDNIGIDPNKNPPSRNDTGQDLDYFVITPPHTFDEPVQSTISYSKAKNFAEAFKALVTDAHINDVKNTLSTSIKVPLNLGLKPGDKVTINTATTRYYRRITSINGTIKLEGLIDSTLVATWEPMSLSLGIDRNIPLNYIKKTPITDANDGLSNPIPIGDNIVDPYTPFPIPDPDDYNYDNPPIEPNPFDPDKDSPIAPDFPDPIEPTPSEDQQPEVKEQQQDPVKVLWIVKRGLVLGSTLNYTTARIFG